ncbi:EAL and HDOD domain-containing protein [Clostridium intestinale]|uniref:EAL and HDOD domain-containing protein n=1 Tax=Clostridium intestinale TaxID=36845 RepID=UPI002DD632EB|nr:HDOD domain-containing protein [Clostridium intestinale]WRY49828.1 HDOD domain-containing protein [Clostridium intestinale]
MDIFLARQPIFDKKNKIIAYELLFRTGMLNKYNSVDGDNATIEVIKNTLFNFGIEKIAKSKKVFINFTENILKSNILDLLSPEYVIVEILEDIEPTLEIINICRKLKEMKYTIALDDFVFHDKYKSLMGFVDIIKVDFRITKGEERKEVIKKIKNKNIKFLAEKVETIKEFNDAVKYGYSYFQGYYLSKPVVISGKKIPENKIIHMRLMEELNSKDFSLEKVEELIKKDISLSYKLLRIVNSAEFGLKYKITSIKQALSYTGETQVKKWLYLVSIKAIGDDRPDFIIFESLARAKFGELIFLKTRFKNDSFNAYLTGMLSLVDVILEKPIDEILEEILVDEEVKSALIGEKNNKYGFLLSLILNYEQGKIDKIFELMEYFNISTDELRSSYMESIEWSHRNNL